MGCGSLDAFAQRAKKRKGTETVDDAFLKEIEGWREEEYVVLFDEQEIAAASQRYQIERWLPGFHVAGLRGWDDLIVRDQQGCHFTVPTVPVAPQHLARFSPPALGAPLTADTRFTGRVKWYIKPLVFGGDPELAEDVAEMAGHGVGAEVQPLGHLAIGQAVGHHREHLELTGRQQTGRPVVLAAKRAARYSG